MKELKLSKICKVNNTMSDQKLIFIAHPIDFFSKTLKNIATSHGLDVYILDEYEDFNYLASDLKPEMILVHEDIFEEYEQSFRSAKNENKCLLSLIGTEKTSNTHDYYFVSPLDPNQLVEEILAILKNEN